MIKQTITYVDYNGTERTEDFWFHLSKADLAEWNIRNGGTFGEKLQRAIPEEDWDTVADVFQKLIVASYGRKSDDGRSFVKTQQLTDNFKGTEAYSQLYIRIVSDLDFATAFINGVVPKDVAEGMVDFSQPQPTMNREQRRAQPQDFKKKQERPAVAAPVVQPDLPTDGYHGTSNADVLAHNLRDNSIPEETADRNEELDAFQAWEKQQEADAVDQAAAERMGVSLEKYRAFKAFEASKN